MQKKYLMFTGVWAVFISIASGIPNLKIKSAMSLPGFDIYAHIAIFAVFAYLVAGSVDRYIKFWKIGNQILLVVMLTIIFGCLDEMHQSMVVGRSSSLVDLLADGVGGFVGVVAYKYIHNKQAELK